MKEGIAPRRFVEPLVTCDGATGPTRHSDGGFSHHWCMWWSLGDAGAGALAVRAKVDLGASVGGPQDQGGGYTIEYPSRARLLRHTDCGQLILWLLLTHKRRIVCWGSG